MSFPHTEHSESDRRSPAATLGEWWRGWMRGACSSDFVDCSPAEMERMARDVGLSSSDLQMLARHSRDDADLLFRRMAALELDLEAVADADRATYLDLERVCTVCASKGRCKRDLASRPDDARWEDYCPNVATLKMLSALPGLSRRVW